MKVRDVQLRVNECDSRALYDLVLYHHIEHQQKQITFSLQIWTDEFWQLLLKFDCQLLLLVVSH